ncbi:DUF6777 domain-containing protein [Streptomyces sp. NPDC048604]|uniref:DUF6777 domain-containing protein n=1 Tax=Streptomyces sp. NPDC048604 TaxID=3365578 RepID=UPI00371B8BCC
MTSQPPSGRPTGPPSGPLSGPSSRPGQAGPPPPSGPPSGGGQGGGRGGSGGFRGGGGGRGGGEGPWWRSVPKIAAITAAIVAAVILAVVLTRSDDGGDQAGGGSGEVFLQSASSAGPDPFTKSTARTGAAQSPAPLPSPTGQTGTNVTRTVDGSAEGLYGGTKNVASCNVEQQVRFLAAEPDKNRAFASVLGISESAVPGYLRGLTPLQLRVDTRVTNHGFKDGGPTTYQAVLQAGTAVMVDDRGVPRVRCACGNPLTPPVPQKTAPKTTGTAWPGYRTADVIVVAPSVTVVNIFVIYDPDDDAWFTRKPGHHGRTDRPTTAPTAPPSPSASDTGSPTTSPPSPKPCVTVTDPAQSLSPGESPCPSTLTPPTSASPDTASPDTDTPSPPSEPAPVSPDDGTTTDQSAGVESPQTDDTGLSSPDAPGSPDGPGPAQGPDAPFTVPTF